MTTTSVRGHASASSSPVLTLDHLTVRFGAFTAVRQVSLEVWPGEIVGVIGPNGAGKSTLINAITGVVPASEGSVAYHGDTLIRERASRRARRGLVRTFQTAELFGSLTGLENLRLARGRRPQTEGGTHAGVARDDAEEDQQGRSLSMQSILAELELTNAVGTQANRLSGGEQKLLEMVRALATTPQVLLLDEPVAGVPTHQRPHVRSLLRRYVDESHMSALLIEHDMNFIQGLCDWIYVLGSGELITSGTWNEIRSDDRVRSAYLGTDPI